MEKSSAEIEAELLDLSTIDVAMLRSVPAADIDASLGLVGARLTDTEGSISGYSGSFAEQMRSTGPESV